MAVFIPVLKETSYGVEVCDTQYTERRSVLGCVLSHGVMGRLRKRGCLYGNGQRTPALGGGPVGGVVGKRLRNAAVVRTPAWATPSTRTGT